MIAANCQTTIDQFRKYRWATPTRTEDDAKERPVKHDDHALDALRYVVASRPYTPTREQGLQHLSGLERAAYEELKGSNFNKRKVPSWEFA